MRMVVDIPEYLVDRARQLIAAERYRDLSSFVAASMENQIGLEEGPLEEESHGALQRTLVSVKQSAPPWPFVDKLGVPSGRVPAVPYAHQKDSAVQALWPWGQINKLLPVKFAVRLLANSVSDSEPFLPLDDFRQTAAEMARGFGQRLEGVDKQLKHKWGERLSAGFPIGDRTESSLDRYANHFVGSYRKSDGRRFGALFELQFAGIQTDETATSIGLTDAGAEFAKVRNPIIDDSDVTAPLGEAEIEFYLRHIEQRVPGECHAFALVIDLIGGGATRRSELAQEIKRKVPFDWTNTVAETYRAGSMSRMSDLDLLTKTKHGQTVEYGVSDRGLDWYHGYSR